jgi:hypothetical protein
MQRAIVAALLVSMALLAAACGPRTPNSTVIGVRPAAGQVDGRSGRIDLSTMAAMLADQMASANNTAPIPGEDWIALGELPVDSVLTLNQVERLLRLQQLGELMIQERQAAIASMVGQIRGDGGTAAYQKANLYSLLNRGSATLHALQVKVARDQLVDVARADVVRIAGLRIYGVLIPKVRILLGAYQLQHLAKLYSNAQANLQQQVSALPGTGAPISTAQGYLNDLGNQINVMSNNSYYMVSAVYSVDASGYPGNRPLLRGARQAMVRAQSAGGAASADITKVQAFLSIP